MNSENEKVAVLVKLPKRTTAYLDCEVAKLERRFGVKSGRACVLRAVADALSVTRFPLGKAEGPSHFHMRDEIVKALTAYNKTTEVRQ
jgi:hypothetical protein